MYIKKCTNGPDDATSIIWAGSHCHCGSGSASGVVVVEQCSFKFLSPFGCVTKWSVRSPTVYNALLFTTHFSLIVYALI
jgi:hypothetical protein